MVSNKTLLKSIDRKARRLDRMKSSLKFTKDIYKWNEKKQRIRQLETDILNLENMIKLNCIMAAEKGSG